MRSGERAPAKANLDKPLEELTEEDIMQLTREDCRRYLKEKGMRRPSWNKSQAIQQVLSLKSLFDSRPDGQNRPERIHRTAPRETTKQTSAQETRTIAFPAEDAGSTKVGWITDRQLPVLATKHPGMAQVLGHNTAALRPPSVKQSGGQLTIFYSGIVNVYDNVPPDKAEAIMFLAGSGNKFSGYSASVGTNQDTTQTPYSLSPANASSLHVVSPAPPIVTSTEMNGNNSVPKTRKASLQRFLEKRRGRGRWKAAYTAISKKPTPMGIFTINPSFLNRQCSTITTETNSTKSSASDSTISPTKPPNTPCRTSSGEQVTPPGRRSEGQLSQSDDDFGLPDSIEGGHSLQNSSQENMILWMR